MDIRGPIIKSLDQQSTPLSNEFFSAENARKIQNAVRRQIRSESGYAIDYQNEDDVAAIMRYIYITNSWDPYQDTVTQINLMNNRTISKMLGQVRTGLAQHLAYLKQINTTKPVNALPVSTSTYGNKMGYNDKIGI